MLSDEDIKEAMRAWKTNHEGKDGLMISKYDDREQLTSISKESLDKYLTPVGYDLRVGKKGFSWNKKRIINIEEEGKIQIASHDTVVIKTWEYINLSKKVSGTIHSMVSKVVLKGLSHISTTLDPGYDGILLISVHNHLDEDIELKFKEPFCTACFYRVGEESKKNLDRGNSRYELWEQLEKIDNDQRKKEKKGKWIAISIGIIVIAVGVCLIYRSNPELAFFLLKFILNLFSRAIKSIVPGL